MDSNKVSIIGAGQCGTLLAVLLARRGIEVTLYEAQHDPRSGKAAGGRSINLALADRGTHALRRAGIYDRIEPLLVPMRGRMVHDIDGSTTLQPYSQHPDEQIYSVSRLALNRILLDEAQALPGVDLHFRHRALDFDPSTGTVRIESIDNESLLELRDGPIVAADGAGSVIRRDPRSTEIFFGTENMLEHGYKELAIPADKNGEFQMDPNALHIWPRGGFMLIALPNPDGDFTLTLFLPDTGPTGFESLTTPAAVETFFAENFPDAAPLIPNLVDNIIDNPLGILGTVRCRHWHDGKHMLLLGDAAHAVVPFHGQGMNLAFEDCVLLDEILDTAPDSWSDLFAEVEKKQIANANAIADMALENYVEMRDTVRDPKFVLRKQLAFELEKRLPGHFIPRYSMIMFHADIPYQVAQQRGRIQAELLEEFTADANELAEIDLHAAVAAATARLSPIDTIRIDRRAHTS